MIPREPRKNMMLAATIEADTVAAPVRIRNLSEKGAMIDGAALPEVGSRVMLKRLELSIAALVIWNEEGRCGLQLAGPNDVDEWVAGVSRPVKHGSLGQLRVDSIQAAIRSGASLPEAPSPPSSASAPAASGPVEPLIAEELAQLKKILDEIGEVLIEDSAILARHERTLQKLDIAAAVIESLADVMAADDRQSAIARIPMHDLRSRLAGSATLK